MRVWSLAVVLAFPLLAFACGEDVSSDATKDAAPRPAVGEGGVEPRGDMPDAGGPERASRDAEVDRSVHPFGCVTTVSAGHHVLPCDGLTFDVEVSNGCASGGCALVLDVHGLTMNAAQQDKSTKLRALGAARGFVVVQPTASSGFLGPSWDPATDDDKVWRFVQDVVRAFAIDERRVHVTGFSQGGAMSWRLVCKHADAIASAAPVCAADAKTLDSNVPPFRLDCPFDAKAQPSRPVPILQMHGTKDGLVPFDKAKQQRDALLAWLGPTQTTVLSSDEAHEHTRFTSTTKQVVFEFLQHDYVVEPSLLPVPVAGHCYPGGDDVGSSPAALSFSCAPPNAFVWGELVLDFFAANVRAP